MNRIAIGLMVCALAAAGCSSKEREACEQACERHADCADGTYCNDEGCCVAGCATDEDCPGGRCDRETHTCAGTEDGGQDAGTDGGTDAGGDAGADPGTDAASGDQDECNPGEDKGLGEPCDCDEECAADNPFCFADLINDTGPTYCTIPDCTAGSCPAGYQCNDFYVNADPPQPPFCQKCLGGEPRPMGAECLCDSDCAPDAPDCFKDLTDESEPPARCTIVGCTVGEGDECPGTFECRNSLDMENESLVVTFCKPCDPGDGTLSEGQECGCNKDCAGDAICTKDIGSEEPMRCVTCLGGEPRGFGEACECDSDCNEEWPTCLVNNNYCSILGCAEDPNITCPENATCEDVFGVFSYCKKN